MNAKGLMRSLMIVLSAATLFVAGATAGERPARMTALSCRAYAAMLTETHNDGRFYISVDGDLYQVEYHWELKNGNWTLYVSVYLVVPTNIGTILEGVATHNWNMGPGGPMPCDGCDDQRVIHLLDPNDNGKPYWKDPGDVLRPSVRLE